MSEIKKENFNQPKDHTRQTSYLTKGDVKLNQILKSIKDLKKNL